MNVIQTTKAVFVSLAFFTHACQAQPQCGEIDDYYFSPGTTELEIGAGDSASIEFTFYPIPEALMAFHSDIAEQIRISTSVEVENAPEFIIAARKSSIEERVYGELAPFVVSLPFERVDDVGDRVFLDFGELGKLATRAGQHVRVTLRLYPTSCSMVDSHDGFRAKSVYINVE